MELKSVTITPTSEGRLPSKIRGVWYASLQEGSLKLTLSIIIIVEVAVAVS